MTMVSACPACDVVPAAKAIAAAADVMPPQHLALSVPAVHCGACISKVETALEAVPGVRSARVNLTLKRALVDAAPDVTPAILAERLAAIGYEGHELDSDTLRATATDRAGRDLLMRLGLAGFAAMNVMLLSVAVWSGADHATRDLFHWISAAIALPAIAFTGKPFYVSAWSALKRRRLNMDVPIVLAILLALATSLWETALSGHHAYFDAALTLVFFLLAGRYLDYRTRAAARSAAEELTALEVPRATRLTEAQGVGAQDAGWQEQVVPIAQLAVGDLILVRPGARMPVDGEIVSGTSELDRSLLTGETKPVFAEPGTKISAGEVNLTGPLTIRALAVGANTSLHRMANLVAIAESGRSRYTSLADRAAKLYAPGVHILSALAFAGWYLYSWDMRTALNIAAAVLIITCPCALGLAVPAVTTAASGRLFRKGLLVKNATALERLACVDTVVFDKTGTLTRGTPKVENWGQLDAEAAGVALALASGSAHPLSQAIVAAGEGQVAEPVSDIREHPGYGVEGVWKGLPVRLGRSDWVGAKAHHGTAVYLRIGSLDPITLRFSDALRQGALRAVSALKVQDIQVHLLSGDTPQVVADTAEQLGISQWAADVLPQSKARYIRALSDKGRHVLMVGDGLNDTAALTSAHVSISPASALDAARVASDIVLLGGDLTPISDALEVARSATRRIRENFRIATLYNVVAVPLAVAGLATPLMAAIAMSSSSITVSLNALRVRSS